MARRNTNQRIDNLPTADYVRAVLDYDPLTGEFRWKYRPDRLRRWNTRYAGTIAGCVDTLGYRYIALTIIKKERWASHRLAWLFVHGKWPAHHIDHVNGDTADNRIANLREATNAENIRNRGATKISTSGFKGVYRNGKFGWMGKIEVDYKQIYLGTYPTKEAAYAAYCEAAIRLNGEFANMGSPDATA